MTLQRCYSQSEQCERQHGEGRAEDGGGASARPRPVAGGCGVPLDEGLAGSTARVAPGGGAGEVTRTGGGADLTLDRIPPAKATTASQTRTARLGNATRVRPTTSDGRPERATATVKDAASSGHGTGPHWRVTPAVAHERCRAAAARPDPAKESVAPARLACMTARADSRSAVGTGVSLRRAGVPRSGTASGPRAMSRRSVRSRDCIQSELGNFGDCRSASQRPCQHPSE